MGSTKRLKSVVHNVAAHAISGLSCVHPDLGTVRKAEGTERVSVDLLQPKISLTQPVCPEVDLSTSALRRTFASMLASESWEIGDLTSAVLTFIYRGQRTWPDACYARVETNAGRVFEDAVGADGQRAQILRN